MADNDQLLSPVWRRIFGRQPADLTSDPAVAGKFTRSSAVTEMKMRFLLRTERREDPHRGIVFSTSIYGEGINKTWAGSSPERQEFNERFLAAQMDAVKAIMPTG